MVVYTALDEEFSRPVLENFVKTNGIATLPKFDAESTKTVGLANTIIAEAQQPRCDVFWNNEILNTLRLEKLGLLEPFEPPSAEPYDAQWKSPNHTWHGFAARARVLLVNKNLVSEQDKPRSILDLADPKWRGKVGIAKPLFGTTATHAAALFAFWGDEKAKDFFRSLKQNDVQVLGGNKRVAEAVAAGELAFGLTDSDDAIIQLENVTPVEIIYPDQGPNEMGTLFIPNTVAMIKGAPHTMAARQLVDYLLSAGVESKLAEGPSAQIPLNPEVNVKPRVETPSTIKPMAVDFQAAADKWDTAAQFLRDQFATGD